MKLNHGIVVLVCMLGMSSLQAHKIDPLEDFRYPESLFEIVHEGVVHVTYMVKNHGHEHNILQQAYESLHMIQDQFDVAMRYHATPIKEEDREFLVSMVDRLESLIEDLGGDQAIRSEISSTCESIRMKIMQKY